jgi:hypothetical protein
MLSFGEVFSGWETAMARLCRRRDIMQGWVKEELKTAEFGDTRVDARFQRVMDDLSQKPSVSIPAACGGWNETLAAYRFFENQRVTSARVLQPHRQATLQRIGMHPIVLMIQDTTEINVTRRQERMKGAGPMSDESQWGFYVHPLLAVTPERVSLGVTDVEIWARDLEEFRQRQRAKEQDCGAKGKRRKQQPIEEKESVRWLKGYRKGCEVAREVPQTTIVVISDSEGDIYECFEEAAREDGAAKAEWSVRACPDRNLSGMAGDCRRLRAHVASTRVLGTLEIEVREQTPENPSARKRNQPRSARTATMTVQAARVKLRGPQRPGGRPPDVEINVVLVREKNPPAGEEAIEWLLLTSLPIRTFEQVQCVISYYCCRWQIEVYFKVLKSGCKIEDRQFQDADHYLPCLALYMVIAWRVAYVMMLGRQCPEMSCEEIFGEVEWKAVYTVVQGQAAPAEPPTLAAMVSMVASLGGHLGRKHDGPPGPKAMWIGMQRMRDLALAWDAFQLAATAARSRKKCV